MGVCFGIGEKLPKRDASRETSIGFLRRGDFFWFGGVKYRVGRLIENTNGYVACVNTVTKKVKRFYIDTTVEIEEV
jgi:hypothetical protein